MKAIVEDTRAPYEVIASLYRNSKQQTEHELRQIVKSFVDLKQEKEHLKEGALINLIKKGQQELLGLKRKLSESCKMQNSIYETCKKRIHLHEEPAQPNNTFHQRVVQFLNSRERVEESKKFQTIVAMEEKFQLETEIYEQVYEITKQLLGYNVSSLKQWCRVNSHMIHKIGSPLLFSVLCCDFFITYQENQKEAIDLLRKGILKMSLSNEQKKCIGKLTMILLGVPADCQQYFVEARKSFLDAASKIYHISFDSNLAKIMAAGVSALKTICCNNESMRDPLNCPICEAKFNKFGAGIPMTAKNESVMKCRINGSLINEENYPVALPNGQIYSISGLRETEEYETYFCKLTNMHFLKVNARKVFLA